MTTLEQYEGVDEILGRLEAVRARRWMLRLLASAAAVATVVVGSLLIVAAALGYWADQPPAALRWAMLVAACGLWALAIVWFALRSLLWRENHAQTARFIEENLPELRNDLINSILLSHDEGQASFELVQKAIGESARRSARIDMRKSISRKSLKRWALAGGIVTAFLAAFALLQPGPFKRGLLAAMTPTRYVPAFNAIELVGAIEPGDATVFAGEPLAIKARIVNKAGRAYDARVVIAGSPNPRPMSAGESNTTFTLPLDKVDQTFRYAVRIGGSRWPTDRPWYTVKVIRKVEVEGMDIRYDYPAYTKRPARTVKNAGRIKATVGTKATVTLRLSGSAPAAWIEMQDGQATSMTRSPGGRSFSGTIAVNKDDAYRLVLKDSAGRALQYLPDLNGEGSPDVHSPAGLARLKGYYGIRAVPDSAPQIAFLTPNRDTTVSPGGKLATQIQVSDDFALTAVRFYAGLEGKPAKEIHAYLVANSMKKGRFEYTLGLTGYAENSVVVYYATATDNRVLPGLAGPQTTTTRRFRILVQDAEKLAAEKARRYEQLRNRLMAILKLQLAQQVNTEICLKKHTLLDQIKATGGEIHAGQRNIRVEMIDLVDKFPFDAEMIPVQQAIALLANNEAAVAVSQAQVVAQLSDFARRDGTCGLLAATQKKITDMLEDLLAVLPSLAGKADAKQDRPAGDDLPPEVRERLAKLKADLDKFIDAQKKIIQASDRLTKKAVDDFTAEDEKLLRELIARQDKWEKFLNEAFTDFSKMAQQDFSNPVLLEELVSVKSDVTMAKDALKKKAIEIATAIEDNGIENAKTLTANLEKWLPDEPDTIKWSQEDPAGGQENVEQPELPKELEDLVGDLLEQEEDLFDEMDDITGKYTMSGDKGIGWDAMDGPISNMNAQGVTGNQLPNTNEMGGRSGEGRQGKSTGEFVEDKAVGKGGRRTPTRVSPEPFQKGQVDDKSTDPAGGATGGGKLSGAGGEGLEGPVPAPLAKELQRLAGRQATLINRAEKHRAKYKPNDYRNFKLTEIITLMNRVRNDLENNRYRNVLRARHKTLSAIRRAQLLLTGKVSVSADTTSAMPKRVSNDISDAMNGKLPAEYEDVLREYFRRLSEQGGK